MNNEKDTPTWEILGVLIGFVSSAESLPKLLNACFGFYESEQIPRWFFNSVVFSYLLLVLVLSSRFLFNLRTVSGTPNRDELVQAFRKAYFRAQAIYYVKMFPLSVLCQFLIFEIYRVTRFDIFRRHEGWPSRDDYFDQIGRFRVEDKTIQIQYPLDFSALEVKETIPNSDTFGPESMLTWRQFRYRWLTMSSWLGLYWTFMHLLKKLFSRFW